MRKRADGSIGPLFVDRKLRIQSGIWIEARMDIVPKGLATRPGWHVCRSPGVPHLKDNPAKEVREWWVVDIEHYEEINRPESQGGIWYLAKRIKFIEKVTND